MYKKTTVILASGLAAILATLAVVGAINQASAQVTGGTGGASIGGNAVGGAGGNSVGGAAIGCAIASSC